MPAGTVADITLGVVTLGVVHYTSTLKSIALDSSGFDLPPTLVDPLKGP